jgi:uncharacterized integral membrane protein
MRFVRWVIGVALFLALFAVALQNAEPVTLRFYHGWTWQAPLVFVVLAAFVAGVAAGLLAGAARAARLARQLGRLRHESRQREGVPRPDWSGGGGAPGTAPASGPGFERAGEPQDGL